jgi:predicted nucleic acid-binding protein
MSRAVFVDASAWIAFMNGKDGNHRAAMETLSRLLDEGAHLTTTTWAAYEALSLIKTRVGHEAAKKLWDMLNKNSLLIKVNGEIEAAGLKLFFGYKDKTWGVTDCTSIALMQLLGYSQAFAFDEHFVEAGKQSGFEVIP